MDFVSFASRAALALPPVRGVGLFLEYASRVFGSINRPVPTVFDGSAFAANPSRTMDRRLLFTSHYHDRSERAFVKSVLRPGDYAVDIGANVGLYSMLFARLVGPAGEVTAIEAEPANAAALRFNLALNDYSQVRVVEAGVSDKNETLILHLHESNLGMHSFAVDVGESGVRVECRPLADFVKRQPIRLMKIDIEGFEYRVLDAYFSSDGPLPAYLMFEDWAELEQASLEELCEHHGYSVVARMPPNVIMERRDPSGST